ncbi:thioredoxin domain-containing protein [Desulfocapsa sulfexigens]|uniref:thioredoxin domain-containing protein n=1 Tax=Desulfocapsa sulfexigens TaxID=65555 RepID=UPI000345D3B9
MVRKNATSFVRKYSHILGSDDAKVYIVEFIDPACETCAAFVPFINREIPFSGWT